MTRRRVQLKNPVRYETFSDGSSAMTVSICRADVEPLLLELLLLRDDLADRCTLDTAAGKLFIAKHDSSSNFGTCDARNLESVTASLVTREFDLTCGFLLKYYRDGAPEVTHLDIDLTSSGRRVTLVFEAGT